MSNTNIKINIIFKFSVFLFFFQSNIVFGLELKGELIEGALVNGIVKPGSKVQLNDKNVAVAEDGRFIIGFHRDTEDTVALLVTSTDKKTKSYILNIKNRDYLIQKIDGLPAKMVSPPESVISRIQKEALRVKKARLKKIEHPYHRKGFIWPADGTLTGIYGSQRILNGKRRRPHFGVDIAGPVGTPVYATCDGVILFTDPNLYFSGGTIIIGHGQDLTSTYIHLNKILVNEGDFVNQGQLVATMGKTGRVTGPHLDWRMEWNGSRIDPQLLVEGNPNPLK